jgi:hypothetical protein
MRERIPIQLLQDNNYVIEIWILNQNGNQEIMDNSNTSFRPGVAKFNPHRVT